VEILISKKVYGNPHDRPSARDRPPCVGAQCLGRDPRAHPPSGVAEPSRADEVLTQMLKSALALLDVRVLDHIVVSAGQAASFAERGLL